MHTSIHSINTFRTKSTQRNLENHFKHNLFIFYHISCMDMYKYQISSVREHNNFQQIFPFFQEPDPIDGMHPLDCMDVDNMHAFTLGTGQTESGQANTISIRPRSSSEIKSRSRSRCILVSKALIFSLKTLFVFFLLSHFSI